MSRAEVFVRSDVEVERIAVALVRESVAFRIEPEPNGWWRIRATFEYPDDLKQLAQAARADINAGRP